MGYYDDKPTPKTFEQVRDRAEVLRQINEPQMADRFRIRSVLNGGRQAINALLKDYQDKNADTLPAANMIADGIEAFSHMIAPVPALRIDPPSHLDTDPAKKRAQNRTRIVENYDRLARLPLQLERMSQWLPGYGFSTWYVVEGRDKNNGRYPRLMQHDPYTTWPGEWGIDYQPSDVALQFWTSKEEFARAFPDAAGQVSWNDLHSNTRQPGWDGVNEVVEFIRYIDGAAVYLYSPLTGNFLMKPVEHPLNRAPISLPRRTTFDQLKGQFSEVFGLAASIIKFALLSQISMEEAVFAPVVVNGRMEAPFRKGRNAVNFVEGGSAQYLQQNQPYQMAQEVDRLERYLRASSGYSKQADGETPANMAATGAGLEQLQSGTNRKVERYHRVIADGLVDIDSIRLEWDEVEYGGAKKTLDDTTKGVTHANTYDPSEIGGHYGTRRIYGLMAGWDEPTKLVGGLQLVGSGAIDLTTLRENLSGLDNIPRIEQRLGKETARRALEAFLMQGAEQGDPKAVQTLLELNRTGDWDKAFEDFYKQEEEAAPAGPALPEQPPGLEQAMAMAGGGGPAGAGDTSGQTLSRLSGSGRVEGGAQVVAPMGG